MSRRIEGSAARRRPNSLEDNGESAAFLESAASHTDANLWADIDFLVAELSETTLMSYFNGR